MTPPPLRTELLAELERRWRLIGAPIIDCLKPGLSDAEMDELTAEVGLKLPPEVRIWWGWHDVEAGHGPGSRDMTGTRWEFLRLEEALAEADDRRKIAIAACRSVPPGRPFVPLWRQAWLPVAVVAHGALAVVDCEAPPHDVSPVYYVEWPGSDSGSAPETRSFGEMVSWWIDAFDNGAYWHDTASGRLSHLYERLDPQRELTRLT